jgi:hypothetical protein
MLRSQRRIEMKLSRVERGGVIIALALVLSRVDGTAGFFLLRLRLKALPPRMSNGVG